MKKFELIVGLFAVFSILLYFSNIQGSGLLIALSFVVLAIFYYLSFALFNGIRLRDIFKSEAYKHTNAKRIIGAVEIFPYQNYTLQTRDNTNTTIIDISFQGCC